MTGKAIIVGAGTYGEVYLHHLRAAGVTVIGFLDDAAEVIGNEIGGVRVLGTTAMIRDLCAQGIRALYAPIGNNVVRVRLHELARSHGLDTPNFIHQSAIVDSKIEPNTGVFVLPGSIIMPSSSIGLDVMISANVSVAHHTRLDQGVFLSTKASVGANIHVGSCAYVGMGGTLVTGKVRQIGKNATIGAGSVVTKDVLPNTTVAGVPARQLEKELVC